ncbi:MAG: ATP-binding cassette domain-containing protein, partial [Bacteroidales bacterium]|nr:ATP-binding cassette domain-containing protein [Bacteroidales bacterium]
MSERILKALMELFAIIVRPEDNISSFEDRRPVVESFLKRQLNQELVPAYLDEYDKFQKRHQDLFNKRGEKRISAISVKILRICGEANPELTQRQKLIILVHLFEFVSSKDKTITEQEYEFIASVADSFNIPGEEHDSIRDFVICNDCDIPKNQNILLVNNNQNFTSDTIKHITSKHLKGQMWILHVPSDNLFFMRYLGVHELYLNGQLITTDKVYIFNTGSSIRDHNITPIYYSDVANLFHRSDHESEIYFEVDNISYSFKSGKVGLYPMSFSEQSGRLAGIMGASGAGKSTLLNVLNGSTKPKTGTVKINGIDIYRQTDKTEGLIGHVSQDDLLIEELTVFQNLYYNAKLCFGEYSEEQIVETVDKMLQSLGLFEIKDIQVGSPFNKKISGGQRKRLNIALELIREPSILFLDEPTSGLSSRDSENIMDLLKELSLKGKLVFVVIHQPSSDIFKMFDKLLILDTGGYLIYDGDPIESILYFKQKI